VVVHIQLNENLQNEDDALILICHSIQSCLKRRQQQNGEKFPAHREERVALPTSPTFSVRSKIMRIAFLSPLALGAVVLAALAHPVVLWAGEPARLTGTQMDAVTAGAVAVGVGAWATADGTSAYAYTSTSTTVFSTPNDNVEIGRGLGSAGACCGSSTDTDVQTAYSAEGDKVIAHSNVHDHHTPRFSFSQGHITVIAIDVPFH
jgi:hypothetical protein